MFTTRPLPLLSPRATTSLRDTINRHRRLLAATLAAITVLAALNAVQNSQPMTVVITATHAMNPGTRLTQSDVAARRVPRAATLGAATSTTELTGRTLLVGVAAGQPMYLSFALSAGAIPSGLVAVPLRPSDAAVGAMIRAGEHVDVVGQRSSNDTPSLLARDLAVLTVTTPRTTGFLKSSSDTGLVVVLADSWTATVLAAASLSGPVALTLRS